MPSIDEVFEWALRRMADHEAKKTWIELDLAEILTWVEDVAISEVEGQQSELSDEELEQLQEDFDNAVAELQDDASFNSALDRLERDQLIEVTRKRGKRYFKWTPRPGRPKTVPKDHKRIMVRMTAAEHEQVKAFLKKIRKK